MGEIVHFTDIRTEYEGMEYILTVLAIFLLTVKGVGGKKVGVQTRHSGDAYLFSMLRMALCVVVGFFIVIFSVGIGAFRVEWGMLLICLLSGIANAALLIFWLMAVARNAMVTVDVVLTIGSILPAIMTLILFGEAIAPLKLVGFGLILVATAILAGYNKQAVGSSSLLGFALAAITAVSDGAIGMTQQLYKHMYTVEGNLYKGTAYSQSIFHFYTYLFAALILLAFFIGFLVIRRAKRKSSDQAETESPAEHRRAEWKRVLHVLPIIAVMAGCMFGAAWLQTTATGTYGMPSQIMYPMTKGGTLITVNITAFLFFGERITVRSVIGSLVALCGVVAMNIL